jgi:hypothetical protein
MRLRKSIFVCALVLVMPLMKLDRTVAQEAPPAEVERDAKLPVAGTETAGVGAENRAAAPVPTPLTIARKDAVYASAYKDAYQILSGQNPCSRFFGGPLKAVEVLNGLFDKLEASRLSSTKVGLSMYGSVRMVSNDKTGASYRLFDKAVINTRGPFYQRKFSNADPFVPGVGSFQPNTREARATILLHEMGHLLQADDGHWLLPNDGESDEQSRKNTETIETRCGKEIKELGRDKRGAAASAPGK